MVKKTKHPPNDDKSRATEQQLKATIQQLRASQQQLKAANQQMQATEQQLRAANQQLDASNQQLRATQEEFRKLNHDLAERVKELNCLYGLSHLVERRDITLEEIFQGLVELMPPACQYPEITAARIIFEGRRFKTENFRKTAWIQSAEINAQGKKVGSIEVCYLKKRPAIDEGPFLKQERELLNALAERLGRIIECRKAEQALHEEHSYLEKLIDYSNVPIIVWDPNFRVTRFNHAFEHLTGYTADEVISQKPSILFPKASRDESLRSVKRTLSGEYWELVEIPILCKNGEIRLLLWNSANIYDEDGTTLLATIAQGQDITERKKAEEALQAANEQLKATNQQLRASQQQLRSANQQLRASQQQLHAELTEHKKAEKERDELLNRQAAIIENVPAWIFLKDAEGRYLAVNQHFLDLLPTSIDNPVGKRDSDLFRKDIADILEAEDNEVLTKGLRIRKERRVRLRDGRVAYMTISLAPVRDRLNNIIGLVAAALDITERKKAEEALRAANQQLEAANRQLRASEQQLRSANQQLQASEQQLRSANQQLRASQQQLLDYQEQLKSLASQLTLTEEHERHRIATDLHATIGQLLVSSKLQLDTLRASSPSGDDLARTLGEVCNLLEETIQQTRTLVFDLSSPVLYELGFETAVAEWLDEQIQQKHHITCEFEDDGQPKPLDNDVRVLLFRDVRELLINVVKHAQATKVKVSVGKVGSQIHVSVEDDGWGFDPKEVAAKGTKKGGFGLFSIRERLEQLGGHIEIKSAPGHGCRVTMMAPLKEENITNGG